MKKFSNFIAVGCVVILASIAMSCGSVLPTAPTITVVPSSYETQTATITTQQLTVLVNVKNADSVPVQGTKVFIMMPLHDRQPFANGATIHFIDTDGVPITIDSPDGSSEQGTLLEKTTDTNGNVEFSYEAPTGGEYNLDVHIFTPRAAGVTYTHTFTVGS